MILDCYQCSSCYFEDKEPSTRIDNSTISPWQPKMVFTDALVVFVCIEQHDGAEEIEQAVKEFAALSHLIGKRQIVLCPNVHMSIDKAPEFQAVKLIELLSTKLTECDYKVHRLSFGYHKKYGMECNGNVGSVVGRRFYGSEEKQFLRFLTRLGVCPPESLPENMPSWATALLERRLKVLANRRETYSVAKKMLQDELEAEGPSELWTCMLFEGERQPMEDYLSSLYEIIEDYPDIKIHRALNLNVPVFANAARFLFHKYPEEIESGRLLIYSSQVSDIEFLLTRSAVLLAFPKKPSKAGLHAGEISFGIYCKDDDFSKNLIQWYRTFLVDTRFGHIKTESELNKVIEETFQDSSE